MAKHISDEQMDEIMETLTQGLNGVFDGIADVKCIKGKKDDVMNHMMDTYMSYPIIKLYASRSGCDVSVNKCSVDDVIQALPNVIGSLLGLVPSDTRNDILYQAINQEMSEDGSLLDRDDEEEDDE